MTFDAILNEVFEYTLVTPSQIKAHRQTAEIALARHIYFYLAYFVKGSTMKEAAEYIGHCTATAHYGIIAINERLKTNQFFKGELQYLIDRVKGDRTEICPVCGNHFTEVHNAQLRQ